MSTKGKIISWLVAILLVGGAVFVYFKFYFVFGEGVKAGELNQIVYKGWVWKTYEGRLIQTGFKSNQKTGGSLQSNEFNFSVVDKAVERPLSGNSLDISTFSGCAQVLVRSVAGQNGPVTVTVGTRTLQLD